MALAAARDAFEEMLAVAAARCVGGLGQALKSPAADTASAELPCKLVSQNASVPPIHSTPGLQHNEGSGLQRCTVRSVFSTVSGRHIAARPQSAKLQYLQQSRPWRDLFDPQPNYNPLVPSQVHDSKSLSVCGVITACSSARLAAEAETLSARPTQTSVADISAAAVALLSSGAAVHWLVKHAFGPHSIANLRSLQELLEQT